MLTNQNDNSSGTATRTHSAPADIELAGGARAHDLLQQVANNAVSQGRGLRGAFGSVAPSPASQSIVAPETGQPSPPATILFLLPRTSNDGQPVPSSEFSDLIEALEPAGGVMFFPVSGVCWDGPYLEADSLFAFLTFTVADLVPLVCSLAREWGNRLGQRAVFVVVNNRPRLEPCGVDVNTEDAGPQ